MLLLLVGLHWGKSRPAQVIGKLCFKQLWRIGSPGGFVFVKRGRAQTDAPGSRRHDVHQLLRHHDDFLDRLAVEKRLRVRTSERGRFDLCLRSIRRHDDATAQLAVDLHGNFQGPGTPIPASAKDVLEQIRAAQAA